MQDHMEFEQNLEELLNNLGQEQEPEHQMDVYGSARERLTELNNLKQALKELENKYLAEVGGLNMSLAGEIRKFKPALTVKLGRDGVGVSYHRSNARSVMLRPDVKSGCWSVGDSPFERQFSKHYGENLRMGLESIGRSIADHFTKTYKTLGEDIVGEGSMIVEDITPASPADNDDNVIGTGTVEGAGILSRLRGAYGELRVAYDFAKRSGEDDIRKEINKIGSELIDLVNKIRGPKDDENDHANYDRMVPGAQDQTPNSGA